jgi:endonuclease G, mitochondrial
LQKEKKSTKLKPGSTTRPSIKKKKAQMKKSHWMKTCLATMMFAMTFVGQAQAANVDAECPQFFFKGAPVHQQKAVNANSSFLCHKAYSLQYFHGTKTSLWVAERLQGNATSGAEERTNDFAPDPSVPSGTSASNDDYKKLNRGLKARGEKHLYDRGHMAPAGDFSNDDEAMHQSFYLSNMVPQVNKHNQGIWKDLEVKVRQWARSRGTLFVVTGPIFRNGKAIEQLPNGLAVPTDIYKVVIDPQRMESIAFLIPNQPYETVRQKGYDSAYRLGNTQQSLDDFMVPINAIEQLAQLNFSPTMNAKEVENLEMKKTHMWRK